MKFVLLLIILLTSACAQLATEIAKEAIVEGTRTAVAIKEAKKKKETTQEYDRHQ